MPSTRAALDSRDFARVARAIAFIDAHYREQPRLARIAAHVGLSAFHFNRLFRRWAGVTPKQYLAHITARAAERALEGRSSVLDAAYSVGLSGSGRLHDLIVTIQALTPGELKSRGAGVEIRHGIAATPFGTAFLADTARGLLQLAFLDDASADAAIEALRADWPRAVLLRDDAHAQALASRIWRWRAADDASLRLAPAGTNFQVRVWEALLELGSRTTLCYGELAAAIGAPEKTRAVANAVGANPIAWLIPCHHVLRKSGALGGYRWGEARKRAILAWEGLTRADPVATPHGGAARTTLSTAPGSI